LRNILRHTSGMAFNDRAFSKLNQTLEGQRIWALVRRPDIQQDLITAARLGRPSVEILADDLIQIIPAIAKPANPALETEEDRRARDHWRRFVGAVVGHVMVEEMGWRIVRQGVRIPAANRVFATGTTFLRRQADDGGESVPNPSGRAASPRAIMHR
jgi:hypothetical protein